MNRRILKKPITDNENGTGGFKKENLLAKEKSILQSKKRLEKLADLLDSAVWRKISRNGSEFYFYYSEKASENFGKVDSYSVIGDFLAGDHSRLDSFVFDAKDQKTLNDGKLIAFYIEKKIENNKTEKFIAKQRDYGANLPSSGKSIGGLSEEHAAELLDRIGEEPEVYDSLEFVNRMNKQGMNVPIPDKLLPREIVFVVRKEGDELCVYSHAEGGWFERGTDVRSNIRNIAYLANLRELEELASNLGSFLITHLWMGDHEFNALVRTALALHVVYVQPPEKWDAEKLKQARPEVQNLANEIYQGKKWLFDKILSTILKSKDCTAVDIDAAADRLKAPNWKEFEPGIRNKNVETVVLENLEKNGIDTEKLDGRDINLISRMAVARVYLKEVMLKLGEKI